VGEHRTTLEHHLHLGALTVYEDHAGRAVETPSDVTVTAPEEPVTTAHVGHDGLMGSTGDPLRLFGLSGPVAVLVAVLVPTW
jgi:hypothetical protein